MEIEDSKEQINRQCGLFQYIDSIGSKKRTIGIEFPLKSICYDVRIIDGLAEISQTQVYYNNTDKFMEVQFMFPIHPAACLHKFSATFADKIIEGRIKEKQNATRQYQKAVKQGRRAAYGQISQESKDIMTIRIGNVGPATDVKIQICYLEELKLALNTFYSYQFQTKMTPRYFNRLPRQDFIHSFRNKMLTISGQFQWDFKLSVQSTRKIVSFNSPSHSLRLQSNNDAFTALTFTLDNDSLKSSFNFLYTTENFQLPSFTMGRTDASTTVMVSFIPKFCSLSLGDAQKAATSKKSLQFDIDSVMGEYIFLLDRSGSMGGQKIQSAKKALILFLKSLPVNSYFNVISFGSSTKQLFSKSKKNSNKEIQQAINAINKMKADLGGTEIERPLMSIFKSPVIEGYPKQIFLLTDGEVSNTEVVIELVKNNVKYSRVHAIGVGSDVSKNLIIGCAQKGKGCYVFIQEKQDPVEKVIQLLSDSFSAVISKVGLQFDPKIVQSIVPNPSKIPYILKGDIANFYITFKGHLQEKTNLKFTYTDSINNLPFSSTICIDPDFPNLAFIDKMGSFQSIRALQNSEGSGKNIQDNIYYVKKVDIKEEIINLSIQHQILSKYTAFICEQTQTSDAKNSQITQKGKIQLNVQSNFNQESKINRIQSRLQVSPSSDDSAQYERQESLNACMMYMDECQSSQSPPKRAPRASRGRGSTRMQHFCRQVRERRNSSSSSRGVSRSRSRKNQVKSKYFDIKEKKMLMKRSLRSQSSQSSSVPTKRRQRNMSSKDDRNCERDARSGNPSSQLDIIINQQNFQGFWSEQTILKNLYSKQFIEKLPKNEQKIVAITLLILKWLNEQSVSRQYILIIKKAITWLKKQPSYLKYAEAYAYKPQ